jgi:hypothetical protein
MSEQTFKLGKQTLKFDEESYLANSLPISREQMPQIDFDSFLKKLPIITQYVKVTEQLIPANQLKATQNEINLQKVLINLAKGVELTDDALTFICSNDMHIADGHHRHVHALLVEPERLCKCYVFDVSIEELITFLTNFKQILQNSKDIDDNVISEQLIAMLLESYGMQGPEAVPGIGSVDFGTPATANEPGTKGSGDFPGTMSMFVQKMLTDKEKEKQWAKDLLERAAKLDDVKPTTIEESLQHLETINEFLSSMPDDIIAGNTIIAEDKSEYKKITIIARDSENSLVDILTHIKDAGNMGHSFDIIVDPEAKPGKKTYYWDGDGSDTIKSIDVEDVTQETVTEALSMPVQYTLSELSNFLKPETIEAITADATLLPGSSISAIDTVGNECILTKDLELDKYIVKWVAPISEDRMNTKKNRHYESLDDVDPTLIKEYENLPTRRKYVKIDEEFSCKTLEGITVGKVGDYLMVGVDGEIYHTTYKPLE